MSMNPQFKEDAIEELLDILRRQHPDDERAQVMRLMIEQCMILTKVLKYYDDSGLGSVLPLDKREQLVQALLFIAAIAKDGPSAVAKLTPDQVIQNIRDIVGQAIKDEFDFGEKNEAGNSKGS